MALLDPPTGVPNGTCGTSYLNRGTVNTTLTLPYSTTFKSALVQDGLHSVITYTHLSYHLLATTPSYRFSANMAKKYYSREIIRVDMVRGMSSTVLHIACINIIVQLGSPVHAPLQLVCVPFAESVGGR